MSAGPITEPQEREKSVHTGTRYGGFGPHAKRTAAARTAALPMRESALQAARPLPAKLRKKWPVLRFLFLGVLLLAGFWALFQAAIVMPLRVYYTRVREAREKAYWTRVRHDGPAAVLADLHGNGRVYLLPMGEPTQPYGAQQVAEWLRGKYKLDVRVLPAIALDRAAWDGQRRQYVAELLCEQIERENTELAAEPDATVIGITDQNMYQARAANALSYTVRSEERVAVVSTYGFEDHGILPEWAYKRRPDPMLPAKLRRFVLKDVALLHWHLALNHDPSSLLRDPLSPDLQSEDLNASDLDPRSTKWGEAMNRPCLYFTGSAKSSMQAMSGPALRPCNRKLLTSMDESRETIEVDLLAQVVRDARTDLYLPDSVPIAFERVLRPGGTNPTEFGVSGSHSYDKYLWAESMQMLHEVGPEFMNEDLRRVPWWLPVESLDKWVDADSSGRLLTMHYHLLPWERFEQKDLHGNVEGYLPCMGKIPCYLNEVRNAEGQTLRFQRSKGDDRKLEQLTSPNGSWVKLVYNQKLWLTEILDSRGRSVLYGYNAQGQLVSVSHANGEVVSYAYDGKQRLLSMSTAPDATSPPRELLRNVYDPWGRLVRQVLADGAVYSYAYHPDTSDGKQWMTVTLPDGRSTDVLYRGWQAALRNVDVR